MTEIRIVRNRTFGLLGFVIRSSRRSTSRLQYVDVKIERLQQMPPRQVRRVARVMSETESRPRDGAPGTFPGCDSSLVHHWRINLSVALLLISEFWNLNLRAAPRYFVAERIGTHDAAQMYIYAVLFVVCKGDHSTSSYTTQQWRPLINSPRGKRPCRSLRRRGSQRTNALCGK